MRRWRRRLACSVLCLVITLAAVPVLSGVASAACAGEENIFGADKPAGTWRTNARGTKNTLQVTSRSIAVGCAKATTCSQSPVTDTGAHIASTAHVRLGGATLDWVETGWLAFRHSDGTRTYCWFTEWGISGYRALGQGIGTLPGWASLGDTAQWRVTQSSGNTWKMYID